MSRPIFLTFSRTWEFTGAPQFRASSHSPASHSLSFSTFTAPGSAPSANMLLLQRHRCPVEARRRKGAWMRDSRRKHASGRCSKNSRMSRTRIGMSRQGLSETCNGSLLCEAKPRNIYQTHGIMYQGTETNLTHGHVVSRTRLDCSNAKRQLVKFSALRLAEPTRSPSHRHKPN